MKTKTEKQLLQDILGELKILNDKIKHQPSQPIGTGFGIITGGITAGCQHVSDGMCYTSYPPQYRCKICGQFYR